MPEALVSEVLEEDRGAVRIVRLVRPASKNALTAPVVELLLQAFASAATTPSVRALLLSGVPGAFCSGADLRFLSQELANGEGIAQVLDRFQALTLALVELSKPVIAAVTGPAVGFGADLALACDFRVFASSAYLQEKFVGVGLMPDGGGTYFLTRLLGSARALDFLMRGHRIDAAPALGLGLATSVVADEEVESTALELANSLALGPPLALARIKAAVHGGAEDLRRALSREREGQLALLASADGREGVQAFLQRRVPSFKGQ